MAENGDDDLIALCYSPAQDSWMSLSPLPVKWFGLGHIDRKLVAIGGANKHDDRQMTNKVHTLNSVHRWKQSMPSMPTPRSLPGVLSLSAVLIVAGGFTGTHDICTVEVFNAPTSK